MLVFGLFDEPVPEHWAYYVHCEDLQAADLVQNYFFSEHTVTGGKELEDREREGYRGGAAVTKKWKKEKRGTVIDSCLAPCLLRLFPPSTAIISKRTSPSAWQQLRHPSPLEDAIPFGRRWIGVPSPCMRSPWTESLQMGHQEGNRLHVNTSLYLGRSPSFCTFSLNHFEWKNVWLCLSFTGSQPCSVNILKQRSHRLFVTVCFSS